jgi:hypothetical protein
MEIIEQNWTWLVFGLMALCIAGLYAVFVPKKDKVIATTGARFFVVRWMHSLVWIVLALSFFLRATMLATYADPVALLGGILYVVFIVIFVRL